MSKRQELIKIAGKYWFNFEGSVKKDEDSFKDDLIGWLKNQADMCGSIEESMSYLNDIRKIENL